MYSDDQELSEHERAALMALPRELAPSDLLEERVVRALRSEGHFGSGVKTQNRWVRTSLRVAAAALLFIGGVATGRYMMEKSANETAAASETIRRANEPAATFPQDRPSQPVRNNTTVVAEREQWL